MLVGRVGGWAGDVAAKSRGDRRLRGAVALGAIVGSIAGCGNSSVAHRGVVNQSSQDATVRVQTEGGTTHFRIPSKTKAALPEASLSGGDVSLVAIFLGDCTLANVTYFAQTGGQIENSWRHGGSWRIGADGAVDDASDQPSGWPMEWPAAATSSDCAEAALPPAPPRPSIVPSSP
jgi:hypothetical protein